MRIGISQARNGMKLKLRRKSVYVGTIVALLAMVGGLAVAAVSGIVFTTGTGNQNFGSIATGNTIYAQSGVTATLALVSGDGLASGCSTSASYTSNVANIAVAGIDSTCLATGTWYDELSFSPIAVGTSGASDIFFIAINGGTSGAPFTISASGAVASGILNIYIDDGPTSAAPGITSIDVTVTGS